MCFELFLPSFFLNCLLEKRKYTLSFNFWHFGEKFLHFRPSETVLTGKIQTYKAPPSRAFLGFLIHLGSPKL